MNKLSQILCAILVACFTLPLWAHTLNNDADDAQKRKSHYAFLEAMHKKAVNEFDSYLDLLRHAYALDSTNTAIAHHLGYALLITGNRNPQITDYALGLMKSHFSAHPDDYYENAVYGNVCNKLGRDKEALAVWEKLFEIYPNKQDVLASLAEIYAKNKNFNKAIALYDTIESREGKSANITLRKISYHMAANDSTGTVNEARALLSSAPANVDFNLLMGNVFLQYDQNDSALVYFNKAHDIDPDNGMVYLYRSDYYRVLGDTINYNQEIYNALISKSIDVEDKLEILTEYIRTELADGEPQDERIDSLFHVLIDQHPHEAAIHNLFSQYLGTISDFSGAAEQLGYVVDLDPTNAQNWKQLVLLYLLGGDYQSVLDNAPKALEFNPDNIELYQYIASAYLQIKEYDKSIETFQKAYEHCDSTDFVARSNFIAGMGDAYVAAGDTLSAYKQYEKAIEIYQGNLMAMNNYAYFLALDETDLDKAERLSATTIRYEPQNPTYLDTYAWIFFKKGEYSLALTYMKSAMTYSQEKGESPSAELHEHYGDALFMNGFHEEAVKQWELALKLDPDSELLQRKVKHKTFFFK